jgi:hypothetical protein
MALSSNSIIHFTKTKNSLEGILRSNFKLHYCKESISLKKFNFTAYVPMVSFCDIPLSNVKNHIDSYGSYGIGLTKEWAIRNGLNPVLYFEKESKLTDSYRELMAVFKLAQREKSDLKESKSAYLNILRYIKNYENDLVRSGRDTIKNYRFYDEREWRFVPDYNDNFKMLITELTTSENPSLLEQESLKLMEVELYFEPNDIKYIIINNDSEISEFLEILISGKGSKYSYADIQRLSTRILTTEQIKSDF